MVATDVLGTVQTALVGLAGLGVALFNKPFAEQVARRQGRTSSGYIMYGRVFSAVVGVVLFVTCALLLAGVNRF